MMRVPSRDTMRLGVYLPMSQEPGRAGVAAYEVIRSFALSAEHAGIDAVWAYDHLLHGPAGSPFEIHEAWTILTAIAEATDRIGLGTLVLCAEFRNPGLLAKMAVTLDQVSRGRLTLGVGCGWNEAEFEAFGYASDHRVGRFEDSLAIIHALIQKSEASYDGLYHSVAGARLLPSARPTLPLLVAARGPRMMDLAARYARVWNADGFAHPGEELFSMLGDLQRACDRVGRDRSTMQATVGVNVRYADMPGASAERELGGPPSLVGDAEVEKALSAYASAGDR